MSENEGFVPVSMRNYLDEYVDEFLNSPSNEYVVFDGTSEIQYKGDLPHCCAWLNQYGYPHADAAYSIYSMEAYQRMMKIIKGSLENARDNN